MTEHSSFGRRVARVVALAVGGGVALTLALSSSASADEVIVQDADVVNAGAAVANSGGNVAVGSLADNEAITDQTATGGLLGVASNGATTSNTSDGTANITTGTATATGSIAGTNVTQDVATGDDAGLTVAVQDADVVNAGAAVANSGLNLAAGNLSDNFASTTQDADAGGVANNTAKTSNASNGKASITTGAATATGSQAETGIAQHAASGDGGPGLSVLVQDSDVVNAGAALSNSGLNLALGNLSDNEAISDQTATGGAIANNVADTSNSSDGTASITTGRSTATGNKSGTLIGQSIHNGDPPGLAVVLQNDLTLNLGAALANAGVNGAVGNDATDLSTVTQVSAALIANNVSTGGNVSDGLAELFLGNATATGNDAWTKVDQVII